MSGPVGQLFSKLSAVVASPASSVQNHKIVIDRKTIEKTWKYMDKVIMFYYFHVILGIKGIFFVLFNNSLKY